MAIDGRSKGRVRFELGKDGKNDLPFIVGVLANLSGHRRQRRPFLEWKFQPIRNGRVDRLMGEIGPRLELSVANRLPVDQRGDRPVEGSESELRVELEFAELKDFEPIRIASQIDPLRELMTSRRSLVALYEQLGMGGEHEVVIKDVLTEIQRDERASAGGDQVDSAALQDEGEDDE